MIVCYFGIYKKNYSRNRILIKGLAQNGVKIIECQSSKKNIWKYFDLFIKHYKIRNKYDVLIVGFPGYQLVPLVKILSRKKIIFDAFTSLYDSMVLDRKLVKKKSLKARYYWLLDYLACKMSDIVLLDTQENIDYFVKQFRLSENKFKKILVGSDDTVMKRKKIDKDSNNFIVHFHGNNIPLHGVEYILGAAKLLHNDNIKFNIIGTSIKNQYKDYEYDNINFIDNIDYEKLGDYMSIADVCLGIFGNTDKAKRVIANKVYEAMAIECSVITGRSNASKSLFTDKENILFANMADSQDLADKILLIKNNKDLVDKISVNAYNLFKEKFTPKVISKELLKIIKKKKVIYTAIFGSKDILKDPKFVSNDFDYICFTDSDFKSNVWSIRKVESRFDTPRLNAKLYKILPHKFLSDYDISVWIDGNIVIKKDIKKLVDSSLKDSNMALYNHNNSLVDARSTVAEEARVLLDMHKRGRKKIDSVKLKEQMTFYKKEDFPDKGGLILGTVLFRRHNSSDVVKVMEDWWQQIKRFTIRDQMSFNYVAWKHSLNFKYLNGDLRNDNNYFKWLMHKK